ncbi:MAG: rod shape-determining protein MreC [Bacteroidetes bacterium]|nr:MAG: rod shape-determining protein MreC [Bacteroidota bacterium]MBL1143881.1 rod shape-determining protein MreC [Bacteroidota bacterium]NOG56682.1 rod shape-determining protein MreC [Bacteroidota bacterium]
MRNLIRFIDRYSFFFLFLFFEVIAFYLLFRNNHFQQAAFLNSTNAVSGGLYKKYANFSEYLNLKEINESLSEENRRLREMQIESFHQIFGENIYIQDTLYQLQYHFAKAKVINNSTNKQNNYITLDKGSHNGLEVGMGVISPNGVVGIIKNVSDHYASVLSLLHSRTKVSCKLQNTNYFGSLQWDGKDYQTGNLLDIPNHVKIEIGDTVITSGYSSTFPENLIVGIIKDFNKPEGENFYQIQVSYSNDFKNINQVYVVKNKYKNEQDSLELKTIQEYD